MDEEFFIFLGLDILFIIGFVKFFNELDTFWFIGLLLSIILFTSLAIYKFLKMR